MSDADADSDFEPTDPAEKEIGREMVNQSTGLGSVAAHLYRGEVERTVGWRWDGGRLARIGRRLLERAETKGP